MEAHFDALVREAPIVPETKPLDDLLADLQRERTELAIVVDEYGRTAGIVTIEDIIEEVVGEISDETDPAGGAVRRLANGDWFVRGHVAVSDLEDYGLELPVDTDAYNSVGGFVFAELGRLPKRGDTISANGFSIRVESVRRIGSRRCGSDSVARPRRARRRASGIAYQRIEQAITAAAVISTVSAGGNARSLSSMTTPIIVAPIAARPTNVKRLAISTRCSLSPWRNRIRCHEIGALSMIKVVAAATSVPK